MTPTFLIHTAILMQMESFSPLKVIFIHLELVVAFVLVNLWLKLSCSCLSLSYFRALPSSRWRRIFRNERELLYNFLIGTRYVPLNERYQQALMISHVTRTFLNG